MLDFSGSHILILLVVALVVIGPKDLPKFLRMVGQSVGKMRRLAEQFRTSFDEMARQSELDELRQEIAALRGDRLPEHIAKEPPDPFAGDEPPLAADAHITEPYLPEGATPPEPLAAPAAEPSAPDAKQP
jgi:sec-independent protein translocase protein TatB